MKASRLVGHTDLRGLRQFSDYYGKPHRSVIFYLGNLPRKCEGVDVLPWQRGLREMGL